VTAATRAARPPAAPPAGPWSPADGTAG